MRSFILKRYLVIVVLAVILGLVIVRSQSQDSVPFCIHSAGCAATQELRGKVSTTTYGFPSTYRQVETFDPANTNQRSGGYTGYAQATISPQKLSIFKIITNIIFWFALLQLLARLIKPRKQTAASQRSGGLPAEEPVPAV